MLPGLDQLACQDLAVPVDVMEHVVRVESSFNPFAIGVVGGRLERQPKTLPEALSTVRMLEDRGYNFSLGLAQVNRHNLAAYGLASYEAAFQACPNVKAGARILAECHRRHDGDWGKAFSCYYSGNAITGFRHGYVQKVFASMREDNGEGDGAERRDEVIPLVEGSQRKQAGLNRYPVHPVISKKSQFGAPAAGVMANATGPASARPAVSDAAVANHEVRARDRAFVF